ncbi:hypothetical protein RIF29_14880 [Crotalaria pallida]|uniref:Uncharacterized protein n=1 Tax=Crotalaria pallida TaxID=3830 RepID=A0AAN9IC33_CROPI
MILDGSEPVKYSSRVPPEVTHIWLVLYGGGDLGWVDIRKIEYNLYDSKPLPEVVERKTRCLPAWREKATVTWVDHPRLGEWNARRCRPEPETLKLEFRYDGLEICELRDFDFVRCWITSLPYDKDKVLDNATIALHPHASCIIICYIVLLYCDRVSSLYWELALQALAYEDKTEMESRRRRRSSSARGLDDRRFKSSKEHTLDEDLLL